MRIGKDAPVGALVLVNVYWLPLSLQEAALLAIAIPAAMLRLAPANHVAAYAILASLISLVNVFLPWPIGALSDRLRGDGTPRQALALLGAALNVAGLVLAASASSIGTFYETIILATVGQTVSTTAYQAMLPDAVARAQWGVASGIRGAATLVGTVLGLTLGGLASPKLAFLICAGLVAFGAISLRGLVPREQDADDRAHIRDWHDFIVVFIARASIVFGLSLLATFVLYFFRDVLHATDPSRGTGITGIAALAGAALASIALGVLSDRIRPYRKIIVALSGIPMTIAAVGYAIEPHDASIFLFALLFGVGYGGVLSNGWALALDSMPAMRDVARDLGIWGMATHVPSIIAPLVGGAMIRYFNGSFNGYRALFALAALAFAVGSSSVLAVRGNHSET
ncbi:MAG TPA: MFS transporter [Candidatus Baltobacteraceae bacterium]|nr:MFS transporter [Candidatus Baltobacteraceae bacterium]